MSEYQEKRSAERVARHDTIHIQILSADSGGGAGAEVVHGQTDDVSAAGFKLRTDRPIEPGLILDLLIEVGGEPRRYLLVAEVRWCRPEGDGFSAGFALLDAAHSDIVPWRQLFPAS